MSEKSTNALEEAAAWADEKAVERRGQINVYRCEVCGFELVTINADNGVTPMFVRCRKPGCKGTMCSAGYRVAVNPIPRMRWYRPKQDEYQRLDAGTREHVGMGGLLLGPVDNLILETLGAIPNRRAGG